MILWTITLTSSLIYFLIDTFLSKGLNKIKNKIPNIYPQNLSVSILICARNEEKNIISCLKCLKEQDYPFEKWELLVANDRSSDKTQELLEQFKSEFAGNMTIIEIKEVPKGHSPKKNALSQLQKIVSNEIVITTDADCLVPNTWISAIIAEYEEKKSDMVIGHSAYTESKNTSTLFWGVQSLDFFSHAAVAAAAVGAKIPINSNANNFSYRKKIYDEVGGYQQLEHIASGDDDLLMHKFILSKKKIDYCVNPKSFVYTKPQEKLSGIWQQRKRWASKTIYYTLPTLTMLSFVFLYYIMISILMIWGLFDFRILIMGITAWIIKTLADYIVVNKAAIILEKKNLMRYYFITSLTHIPGIIASVFGGVLGNFEWKGQSHSLK